MLWIIGCVVGDYSPGLVALALAAGVVASRAAMRLGAASDDGWPSSSRMAGAALAFGTGAWLTDILLLLAFRPGLAFRFDAPLSIGALAVILVASLVAFAIRCRDGDIATVSAGLCLGAGIASLHVLTVAALRLSGTVPAPWLILLSATVAAASAAAAMEMLAQHATRAAMLCLILSLAPVHLLALDTAGPATAAATGPGIAKLAMAFLAAAAGLLVLGLSVTASVLEHRQAMRLSREARRLRILADAAFEGLIVERDGRIDDANNAMEALAGARLDTLLGRELAELLPGARAGIDAFETDICRPDGSTWPVEVLWRAGSEPGCHVVAIRDLTREKAAEGRIERMAHFDTLTGLANQDHFETLLEKALALSERAAFALAVLVVDLDQFELVGEVMGAATADQLLVHAARRLNTLVRETDIVARIGRDEFAVIQPLAGRPEDAAALADRIVTEMALPYSVSDRNLVVTVSAGVALYPGDGSRARDLVKAAIQAMRRAKTEGRNRWRYFERNLDRLLEERRGHELDLRTALAEGQFSLEYQPFVDTATRQIVGHEALLRWNHPERGRISPSEFIPWAEASGLIVPLGIWVLETACATALTWPRDWIVAVNLSPSQFSQTGLARSVAEVLRRTGLPAGRLELEITESTLMTDTNNALETLTALKSLGVTIAMDDFGTGYSSLSYLRKFRFDKIKIDRTFISDVDDAAEAEAIVRAIVALGRSLRLDVTAEGVETAQQLSLLQALGCRYVQGYLLGRPCPADRIGTGETAARQPVHALEAAGGGQPR